VSADATPDGVKIAIRAIAGGRYDIVYTAAASSDAGRAAPGAPRTSRIVRSTTPIPGDRLTRTG